METTKQSRLDTIVIKAGTDTLGENGKLNEGIMENIADQIATLCLKYRVIIVSSGAVGAGYSLLPENIGPEMEQKKQALSGLGQNLMMGLWTAYFRKHSIHCAQGLPEEHNFHSQEGRSSMQKVFRDYHEIEDAWKQPILPIINGNDFVSFGPLKNDNDKIAGEIAAIVHAKSLVLLTNVDGLFTGDPKQETSRLVRNAHVPNYNWRQHISTEKSKRGTGGFYSKGEVAENAALLGMHAFIGNGRIPDNIQEILEGRAGTRFYR